MKRIQSCTITSQFSQHHTFLPVQKGRDNIQYECLRCIAKICWGYIDLVRVLFSRAEAWLK